MLTKTTLLFCCVGYNIFTYAAFSCSQWCANPFNSCWHTHTHTHLVNWKGMGCICQLNNPKSNHWHKVSWSPLRLTAGPSESSCHETRRIATDHTMHLKHIRPNSFEKWDWVTYWTHPLLLWGWALRRIIAGSMHLHSVWLATFMRTGSGTNLNGITRRTWNAQKHRKKHTHTHIHTHTSTHKIFSTIEKRWNKKVSWCIHLSSEIWSLTVLFTYSVVVFLQVTPSWLQQPLHLSVGEQIHIWVKWRAKENELTGSCCIWLHGVQLFNVHPDCRHIHEWLLRNSCQREC